MAVFETLFHETSMPFSDGDLMKSSFFRLLALSMLGFLIAGCSSHSDIPVLGESFPYAKFTMMDGSEHILSEWNGKPVVIMFWSADCSGCEHAIEDLNEEGPSLRKGTDIVFIADSLNSMDELEKVEERIKEADFKWFTHAFSGNQVADEAFQTFDGSGTPFFVLINRNGRVHYTGSSVSEVIDFVKSQKSKRGTTRETASRRYRTTPNYRDNY